MDLPTIENVDLKGKRIFVRGDIDVPLENGKITDDSRLIAIWPTIESLLNQDCDVIVAGHLGRPEGKADPALSSKPVARWFSNKTIKANETIETRKFGPFDGFSVNEKFIVLENLRFDPREEADDPEYAKELAAMAQVYVNEAFASCGGEHASIVGIPKLLPHYAGFRLAKEVEVLSGLTSNPKRPMTVIIGGAKLDTKIPVISRMAEIADQVIVGGKLLSELGETSELGEKVKLLDLTSDEKDVTLESIDNCSLLIANSQTVVWNGPMGMIEDFNYQVGTRRLAELITANTGAYKVVGGGDTIGFLDKLGLTGKFDWVSTGGGSMLKLLAGEKLPGIEALLK